MRTQAAVLTATGQPLELVELEVPDLAPGQVLVEIAFSGVCHTQILEARGWRGSDPYLPHCLGHEGSGTVLEVGPAVEKVRAGDAVVLSWMKGAGSNVPGTTYRWGAVDVNAGAVTTFSRHAVVSENRLSKVPADLPLDRAALLGCAVPTGLGSVFNTARPSPGERAVVLGAGGIGLCAVAGAVIAGCWPVVAVDLVPAKLDVARRLGASHVIDAAATDWEQELADLVPGGFDVAVEATGRPAMMAAALQLVRQQGGRAVAVGNAHAGEMVPLDPRQLNLGKRLLGTWGGDNDPERDFPRYARLMVAGKLDVGPLLGRPYPLSSVNQALDDLEAGRAVRPMVDMSLP